MDVLVMKIDGVEGECTLKGYEKQITCLSYNHGISNPMQMDVANIGRSRGRCIHQDFSITKNLDKATTLLNYKCAMGANLKPITFTVLRASGDAAHKPMMIYTLENPVISSVSVSGGGGSTPVETVAINYTKIKWEYKVQDKDMADPGSVAAEWDQATNMGANG